MRYLTLGEVLTIHHRVMEQSGGMAGVGDVGALESAIAQPRMTFAENDLYPTIADKAAALGFQLFKTIHLSMGTNGPVMRRWKPFCI